MGLWASYSSAATQQRCTAITPRALCMPAAAVLICQQSWYQPCLSLQSHLWVSVFIQLCSNPAQMHVTQIRGWSGLLGSLPLAYPDQWLIFTIARDAAQFAKFCTVKAKYDYSVLHVTWVWSSAAKQYSELCSSHLSHISTPLWTCAFAYAQASNRALLQDISALTFDCLALNCFHFSNSWYACRGVPLTHIAADQIAWLCAAVPHHNALASRSTQIHK